MKLIDVQIGTEYLHEDLGRCVVVGIHPTDPSSWMVQVLDSEHPPEFDITEAKFLEPIK